MSMIEIANEIIEFIGNSGLVGALISCSLITVESIIPVLPLMAFIAINFLIFGNIIGFIISWVFTIIGCSLSYYLFKNGLSKKYNKYIKDKETLKTYTEKFKNVSIMSLALITALPFTPAFIVNIAAGLSNMKYKRFLVSIMIGKIALVYFWGFVGTSFIESISNPKILVKIGLLLFVTYLLTRVVNKVLKIK